MSETTPVYGDTNETTDTPDEQVMCLVSEIYRRVRLARQRGLSFHAEINGRGDSLVLSFQDFKTF